MTNEEAIRFGNCILMVADDKSDSTTIEFTKLAIKALKQGDVLQNVKQEISTIPLTDTDGHNGNWFREPQAIIEDVNVIIDRFINEVEQ